MIFLILNSEYVMLLEVIYNKYSKFMYKVAYSILHNKYDAEDAVQQTLIKLTSCIEKIGAVEDKKTRNFIGIICRNIAVNIYNKSKKCVDVDDIGKYDNIPDNGNDLSLIIISRENMDKIEKFIYSLEEKYQNVLFLKLQYGYSIGEIADILDISYTLAQKRLERGRNKLKEFLKKEMNRYE